MKRVAASDDPHEQTIAALKQQIRELQAHDAERARRISERMSELETSNAALRESEAQYRTIFDNSEAATLIIEEDMTVSFMNAKVEMLTGYSKAEIEGKEFWTKAVVPDDLERMKAFHAFRRERSDAAPGRYEFRIRDKQGTIKDIYGSVALIPGTRKSVASLTDITDLKKSEQEMKKLSLAVQGTSDWVLIADRTGVIEYVNHAVEEMSGFTKEELIGQKPSIFKSGKHDVAFFQEMWNNILAGRTYRTIMINRRKSGEVFEIYHTITPLKDEKGEITHFVATSKDLTQQRLLEERVYYLAYYDGLTGLPNTALLLDRIKQEVPRAEYRKRQIAVMAVDIDRFSFINETFGTTAGDEVLREVGRRLSAIIRDGDTVARLGRDKFGIMLADVAQSQDIVLVVNKIISTLQHPVRVSGTDITANVYIGISVYPQDTVDAAELVKNADIALVKSRVQELNTYQFFTADMNRMASTFATLHKSLFHALANGEFVQYYQPYFDVDTRKLAGMEALIRWNSPEHGFVYPSKFIPVLEETRMIINVGKWCVKETCRQIRDWQRKGYALVPVSVNLSAVQFKQPDIGDFLETTIRESGIDPGLLTFELTESTLMQNPEQIRALLIRLKALGISVSIDDFGTGYSSLSYLKKLPVDNIKIDISFVRDITTNADDGAIVSSIVSMAHNLRMKTIAEGVETEEQLKILNILRCDMVQGFYFSKAVPAETVEAMLTKVG